MDVCDDDHVPPRRTMAALAHATSTLARAVELEAAGGDAASGDAAGGVAAAAAAGAAAPGGGPSRASSWSAVASSECRKAIRAELRKLHREPHAACEVFPSERDLAFWKVRQGEVKAASP